MQAPDNGAAKSLSGTVHPPTRMPGALIVRATNRTTGEVRTANPGHPFAILGRAPAAGVRLDDPSVSQVHAYLQLVDGVPYCIDLGSRTGVLWDDGTQARGWVLPGQTVRIGIFDVQLVADGAPDTPDSEGVPTAVRPHAALDVHSPSVAGGRFSLDLPVTLVGRHPNCNLRFLDEGVPYFQCALVNASDGLWCVNLAGSQGTLLNGRQARVALLRDGDLIETGRTALVARVGADATQPIARTAGVAVSHVARESHAGLEAAAFEPLRGMMEQFQQCFVTMARMFTTMQQEHTAMMCEQMRQVQELIREVRDARPAPAVAPAAPTAPPPPPAPVPGPAAASAPFPPGPKVPTPKPVTPEEGRVLADAHAWFLDRLTQKGPQPTKPKSE